MKEIHASAEGVTELLKGLNPSKALGSDELHPRVLKELASELGPEWVKCVTRNRVGKPALGFYESLKNIYSSKTNAVKAQN